jgi:sugar/nucleoside kinase (ribokinase family)
MKMKIVSLGAVLLDQIASVDRFPKEDDEVFVPCLQIMPGGSAANFAVICARIGASAGFAGKVGDDSFGDYLVKDLKGEDVNTDMISKSGLPTGTVFVAVRKDGQRMMFAHSGAANDLRDADIDLKYLNKFDHLHLADLENVGVLRYAAKNFKGTVSLNPGALIAEKPAEALELIKDVDILICSEGEALKLSGTKEIDESLKFFCNLGPKVVVITRGAKDPVAFDGKEKAEVPVFKVRVVDATGAGDAFSAGFICEYLKTKDLRKSLRFANAVASIVIQHPGAHGGLKNRAQAEHLAQVL